MLFTKYFFTETPKKDNKKSASLRYVLPQTICLTGWWSRCYIERVKAPRKSRGSRSYTSVPSQLVPTPCAHTRLWAFRKRRQRLHSYRFFKLIPLLQVKVNQWPPTGTQYLQIGLQSFGKFNLIITESEMQNSILNKLCIKLLHDISQNSCDYQLKLWK